MTLFPETIDLAPDASAMRRDAAARYVQLGMPTPKLESWKYTDLRPLQSQPSACTIPSMPEALLPNTLRFVFMNGRLVQSAPSLPQGVTIGSINDVDMQQILAKIAPQDQAVAALNTALYTDGLAVIVAKGVTLAQPIEVSFAGSGPVHVRLVVVLDENSAATLIESHAGSAPRTIVSEVDLGTGARLQHYRLQNTDGAVVLATGGINLAKDALYDGFALTTGGRLSRHQIKAILNGTGGEVRLNGAHILSGHTHADTTTEIVHAAPHCRSRETYRHVMDGTSRSVFQGKIFVAQDAQKTDGFQLNQSLMLSPTAEVNAKPELEIYADDVKCSHGATSGRLDEEALFYLRSRGIPEAAAKQMLIQAFIGSSIDLIENEAVRDAFQAHAAFVLGEGK